MRALFVLAGVLGASLLSVVPGEAAPPKLRPYVHLPNPKATNANLFATWTVPQLCKAYKFPTKVKASGVIGILEFGGGYTQQDLNLFSQINNMPPIVTTDVSVDGIAQNSPGQDFGADIEVALDIQTTAAAYYYCTGKMPTIYVFFMSNNLVGGFEPVFQAAVARNCDVLSVSWGASEWVFQNFASGEAQKIEAAAQAAAAAGLTIFAASGDNSSDDQSPITSVDLPASCPHVVGCGGTSKTTTVEVVWGDGFSSDSGTGGGFSAIFPKQAFQIGAPTPPLGLGRMVPDVAADADPNTGLLIIVEQSEFQVGGTSGVAPLYSGLFAALGKKMGLVTPTLWKNPKAFVDITSGSNGDYFAKSGPDACTGLGVPNGASIAALYGITPPPPSVVTASFSNGTLTITGDANANGVIVTYASVKVANQITNGSITLTSTDPTSTLINGLPKVTFSNIGKNRFLMNCNMGAGDDIISFNSLFSTTSNVSLGDGNDTATFSYCSITTQLNLDGGAGTDTVTYPGSSITKKVVTNVP